LSNLDRIKDRILEDISVLQGALDALKLVKHQIEDAIKELESEITDLDDVV
jgi:predicted  nucleic acid-binding Zn-ribbon protein